MIIKKTWKLFFRIIIKSFSILLRGKIKQNLLSNIKKIDSKFYPNLFDDNEFLVYVDQKHKGLINNIEKIEHLVLGSSHADYGFYPDYIENSFNLGLTSCDLYTSYNIFSINKDRLVNLKNVILFFSVFDNGYSLIQTSEKYRVVAYNKFFNVPYQKNDIIESHYENSVLKQINKITYIGIDGNFKGYEKKTSFGLNIKTEDRVKSHLKQNKREPDQLEWLHKIIFETQAKNINLYIVLPPFRVDYRILLPLKQELFSKLFMIKTSNVHIIDLYNSSNFNNNDFGDTDHLNEFGAKKLTLELKKLFSL